MVGTTEQTRRGQRGFILALLLALITASGILLTRAMPSVIAEVQRDKEAELIFRGEAIRNAMRRYKAMTGNYPLHLEDLMKIRPRILRKLYKDPMTEDGEWDIVTAVQPGATGSTAGLPIAAIRSHSQKDSFRIYQGKTLYSEWIFAASDELLGIPGGGGLPLPKLPLSNLPAPTPDKPKP